MIKLLVVDDEPSITSMLKRYLESLKYAVVTANDGIEALDKVETYHPDIIVLDVLMPKMDGYRVLEELQKKDDKVKHTPVIVLTARKGMKNIFEMAPQVKHFVEKPFDSKDLISKIEVLSQEIKKDKARIFRALLIGMDWDVMRPIRSLLEAREILVFTASDATKSVEEAVKHQPDMIFCASLVAGGMDIITLCNFFKDMPTTKGTPLIVYDTSGHLTASQAERINATKIIDYQRHEDLVTKIDDYLRDFFLHSD